MLHFSVFQELRLASSNFKCKYVDALHAGVISELYVSQNIETCLFDLFILTFSSSEAMGLGL